MGERAKPWLSGSPIVCWGESVAITTANHQSKIITLRCEKDIAFADIDSIISGYVAVISDVDYI